MALADDILKLTKQLYPTGRAFRIPQGSDIEKLHRALAQSEAEAFQESLNILDSILPDNVSFTTEDAEIWERNLGLITDDTVSLDDRKLEIERKMQHPGTVPARQHFLFLERELQNAGFSVFVYENRFPNGGGTFETMTPEEILGTFGAAVHETSGQHGQFQHATSFNHKIVNSIFREDDANFQIGTPEDERLRATFFVAGATISTIADVDANREREFRQLILRVKPVHTLGYLFINYI